MYKRGMYQVTSLLDQDMSRARYFHDNRIRALGAYQGSSMNGPGNNDKPLMNLVRTAFSIEKRKKSDQARDCLPLHLSRLSLSASLRSGFTAYRCFPVRSYSEAAFPTPCGSFSHGAGSRRAVIPAKTLLDLESTPGVTSSI